MNLKKMMKLLKKRQLRRKQLHRRRPKMMGQRERERERRRRKKKRKMMNLPPQEVRLGRGGLERSCEQISYFKLKLGEN